MRTDGFQYYVSIGTNVVSVFRKLPIQYCLYQSKMEELNKIMVRNNSLIDIEGESEVGRMASDGQCPDLDMNKGIKQFGGNKELYLDILGYYIEDMHTLLDSIKDVDEIGLDAYAQTAHAIKGSSRNVFANNFGSIAEKMELAAKEGDRDYISSHHAAFISDAQKLVRDIENMLGSRG